MTGEPVQLIIKHIDDLVDNLPRPGTVWAWGECDLDPSLQQRLANPQGPGEGQLVRSEYPPGWETKESFYAAVVDRAGTQPGGVGVALGQGRLFAPGEGPRAGRGGRQRGAVESGRSGGHQVSLGGEPVEDAGASSGDCEGSVAAELRRLRELYGRLGCPERRAERAAAREPGQTSLESRELWGGRWCVAFHGERVGVSSA